MDFEVLNHQTLIRKESLDPTIYTVSLLKEGYRLGLIDKHEVDSVQGQIMLTLRDLIARYTKGESSSVKIETAEKILNSIYYCIDACTSSFVHPEDSLSLLKTKSIKEIYEKGVELVTSCVEETKALYKMIEQNKLDVPLELYNSTIDEALPDFFKQYSIVFGAHETMCDMDYPVIFDNMNMQGIFYIRQYLEKLKAETEFCSFFSKEDIYSLLSSYGRVYDIDYKKSPVNLFELVINNSIFSALSGNSIGKLVITKLQYELLNEKFISLDTAKIDYLIDEAIDNIIISFNIINPELLDYIDKYKTTFKPRVSIAAVNGSLYYLIISDDDESLCASSIVFEEGNRISDSSFRQIVEKITKCHVTKEKINIIKSDIHSLEDFVDVLKGDCLFGDEFAALYSTLDDMEVAVLAKIVFFEELRNKSFNLLSAIGSNREIQLEWQLEFISFLNSLNKNRIMTIERIIGSL